MATIIDGKKISLEVKAELKEKVEKLKEKNVMPCLAVILAGNNPASQIYVKNKITSCEEVGIKSLAFTFGEDVSEKQLIELIETLNADKTVDGILVAFTKRYKRRGGMLAYFRFERRRRIFAL